jgi:hypothetical protein
MTTPETLTINLGGENGDPMVLTVLAGNDGSLRLVDPNSDPAADAVYVASDMDDLARQVSRDGHWLVGYED